MAKIFNASSSDGITFTAVIEGDLDAVKKVLKDSLVLQDNIKAAKNPYVVWGLINAVKGVGRKEVAVYTGKKGLSLVWKGFSISEIEKALAGGGLARRARKTA